MSDNDHPPEDINNKIFQISSNDAYQLLKIRAAQEMEKQFLEYIKFKYKKWIFIGSAFIAILGFIGYRTISNYIDTKINNSAEKVVKDRIEKPLSKLEGQIDKTIDSGIYAKVTAENNREIMSRIETESEKTMSDIKKSSLTMQSNLNELGNQFKLQKDEINKLRLYISDLYGKQKVELFHVDNTAEYEMVRLNNTPDNVIVILRLANIPIRESVRLQYYMNVLPPNTYTFFRNLILIKWVGIESLKNNPFFIFYSVDSSATGTLGVFSRHADGIYVGGKKMITPSVQSLKDADSQIQGFLKTN